MNFVKEIALGLYYAASQNARRKEDVTRAAKGQSPIMMVFYHRVADSHPNGWTINTKTFAKQIHWMRERFDMISIEEAHKRIASKSNRWPSVAISFDDGYADNCDFALPFLVQENIPVTYFVATDHVNKQIPFSHDIEAGQPLAPNTSDQIKQLSHAGWTIGAHTRTHADIGSILNRSQLIEEIAGSKQDVEKMSGQTADFFAFPFGQHNNISGEAFDVAKEAGFKAVCSAYGGYNFAGDDAFHIQRIHGDPETIRLKNWLTVDPRKLDSCERYMPECSSEALQSQVPTAIPIQGVNASIQDSTQKTL